MGISQYFESFCRHIVTMTLSISIDFKFLLKILNIIVSLIPRDVIMTSRPD